MSNDQGYGQGSYGQGGYGQQPNYPQQPGYGPNPGYPQPQGNGLATASMVCGIIGLILFWFILGPLAIIFGAIGLSRAKNGAPKRGQAMAGLVMGIIAVVGYLLLIAVLVSDHKFVL